MLNRKGLLIAGILIVLSVVVFMFIRQRERVYFNELVTFDATPLYTELSSCNRVRIIMNNRSNDVFESRDADEVRWVIDSIVVNTNSITSIAKSPDLCAIIFFRDGEPVVHLATKKRCRLYWVQASWEWHSDFWLTNESYREFVLWFCEKTGKTEKDLFNP
jgi:hypothetical protein